MQNTAIIVTTQKGQTPFTTASVQFGPAGPTGCQIKLNPGEKRQQILGFGGAFTDSAAIALDGVSPATRAKALRMYFDPNYGLAYNLGRTHIGACDFSTHAYALLGTPEAGHEAAYEWPEEADRIARLIAAAGDIAGQKLLIYAVPWSPPPWMKTNGTMCRGGALRPDRYGDMAAYILHFLQQYKQRGLPLWGLCVQNEPDEVQEWPSCCYSAAEESAFLQVLLPILEANGFGDVNILLWDSNKNGAYERAKSILCNMELYRKVYGVAFHWYSGHHFDQLDLIHRDFPHTALLSTESCFAIPEDLDNWDMAMAYAGEILGNFNHWATGFIDWNLFLDERGGPNLAGNFCAAPLLLDGKQDAIQVLSSYYAIGHFSKYVRQGAVNIGAECTGNTLQVCAFRNPDGDLVAVVLNDGHTDQTASLVLDGQALALRVPAQSLQTILLNP